MSNGALALLIVLGLALAFIAALGLLGCAARAC